MHPNEHQESHSRSKALSKAVVKALTARLRRLLNRTRKSTSSEVSDEEAALIWGVDPAPELEMQTPSSLPAPDSQDTGVVLNNSSELPPHLVSQIDSVDYSHFPTTHINALPPEIFEQIFIHCWDPLNKFPLPDKRHAPMLLCRVSGFWRDVAISSSILWTYFCVPVGVNPCLLELWLRRSRDRSLSFRLQTSLGEQNRHTTHLLLSNTRRWQDVSFHLNSDLGQGFLEWTSRGDILRLEAAELYSSSRRELCALMDIISTHPNLRQLELRCYEISLPPQVLINMIWPRLTSIVLDFVNLSVHQILTILSQCPHIQVVKAKVGIPAAYVGQGVHIPNLLLLEVHDIVNLGTLLDHVILPNLRSLGLFGHFKGRKALQRFIARSSCNLETLVLGSRQLSKKAIVTCVQLPNMQTLRQLTLHSGVSDALMTHMSWRVGNGILPRLQMLELKQCRSTTDGSISAMINSRWIAYRSGVLEQLTYVHLIFHRPRLFLSPYYTLSDVESDTDSPSPSRPKSSKLDPFEADFARLGTLATAGLRARWELHPYNMNIPCSWCRDFPHPLHRAPGTRRCIFEVQLVYDPHCILRV